jgi:hypothetical protein
LQKVSKFLFLIIVHNCKEHQKNYAIFYHLTWNFHCQFARSNIMIECLFFSPHSKGPSQLLLFMQCCFLFLTHNNSPLSNEWIMNFLWTTYIIRNHVYFNSFVCNFYSNHHFCEYRCDCLPWALGKNIYNCINDYKLICNYICNL